MGRDAVQKAIKHLKELNTIGVKVVSVNVLKEFENETIQTDAEFVNRPEGYREG